MHHCVDVRRDAVDNRVARALDPEVEEERALGAVGVVEHLDGLDDVLVRDRDRRGALTRIRIVARPQLRALARSECRVRRGGELEGSLSGHEPGVLPDTVAALHARRADLVVRHLRVEVRLVRGEHVRIDEPFLVPLRHGRQKVTELGLERAVFHDALLLVPVLTDAPRSDERVARKRASRAGSAARRRCPRAERKLVGLAVPVRVALPERREHATPFVERCRHLEVELVEPVLADREAGRYQQQWVAPDERKGVDVAIVGDDHLPPLRVLAEHALQIGRVAVEEVVEPHDHAVAQEPRRSTGRVRQPVVLDNVRVFARGGDEVELLGLLTKGWVLELDVDAGALLQLAVTGDLAEALHRRAHVRAHRGPVAETQRLLDDRQSQRLR